MRNIILGLALLVQSTFMNKFIKKFRNNSIKKKLSFLITYLIIECTICMYCMIHFS